jgi:adenosylcobinamide-phosphate synthase
MLQFLNPPNGCVAFLFAALGAILLDLVLADPPNRLHPVVLMGSYIRSLWARRPNADEAIRPGQLRSYRYGRLIVSSGVLLFSLPWVLVFALPIPYLWLLAIPLVKVTFSIRGLLKAGADVATALRAADLVEARRLLGWHLVSRDTARLSAAEVAGAAVESLAENVTDSLASPLFFFALFGVPGTWAYRYVNTCDSLIAYRDPEHEWGGKFAAQLDTILNWIPARLSGLAMVAAAAVSGMDARGAWRTMWTQRRRTESRNAGWTMAAAAGALGVTLSKRESYRLEGGNAPLSADTIIRCCRLIAVAMVLLVGLLVGAGSVAVFLLR